MNPRSAFMIRGVLATTLALGLSGPVVAAESGGTEGETSMGEEEVSQADLEKFAAAYGEIQSVRAEYGRKLQETEDQAEREQLKQEGQEEMVSAIENEGLELSEYQQIGQQLNSDEELRSRLHSVIQEQQGQGGTTDPAG